jgi:hypothetical protein
MTRESTRTHFLAGDFISESAVRGVFGRRQRRRPLTPPSRPVDKLPANSPTAGEDTSPRAAAPAPIRRWSVAELVARAIAEQPADAVIHC